MAVFGRESLGSQPDFLAEAPSVDGFLRQEGQRLRRTERRLDADLLLAQHPHLVQLHHRTHGGAEADGVNAFLVAEQVGVLQALQVVDAVGRAQGPGRFVFQATRCAPVLWLVGHGEVVLVHLADPAASDGAAKAGLVGHQLLFAVGLARCGHGFGANVLGAFELVVPVVAGGQAAHLVDDAHQHLRAVGRQALTRHAVLGQHLLGVGNRLHERFGVADVAHALGATHGNRLQVLAAHDGAHAGAARRAVQVVDHGREQHAVLAGLADAGDAGQRVLQALLDDLLGLPDALAPQMAGIAQLCGVVVDVQVHRRGTLAFENDHVPTGHLELGAPVAARVGAGHGPRQRPLGDDGVATAGGRHGSGERAGGPDDLVGRRKRIDGGIDLFDQVLGSQTARAQVGLRPLHVERFGLDGASAQVDAENFSCPRHDGDSLRGGGLVA